MNVNFWNSSVVKIASIAIAAAALITSCAHDGARKLNPVDTEISVENSVSGIIESFVEDEQFAGVALIADKRGVIFQEARGLSDRELGTIAETDHVFVIGSMTKAFTAALVLQLSEEGAIDLNAPAIRYWSEFPDPSGGKITVDHLLTHRSGLRHWGGVDDFLSRQAAAPWEPEDIVSLYAQQDLQFEPGAENAYSSIGYLILGVILEEVTNQSYGDLLRERIFKPLGMGATRLDNGADIIKGRVRGYRYNFLEARYDNAEYRHPSTTWSTGGILTTAEDLAKWAKALHGSHPEIITTAMRDLMFDESKGRQAYGWDIRVLDNGEKIAGHGGLVTGYRSQIELYLDRGETYIALSNLRDAQTISLLNNLAAAMASEGVNLAKPSLMKELLRVSAAQGAEASIMRYNAIMANDASPFDKGETQALLAAIELRSDGACDRAAPIYQAWLGYHPESRFRAIALGHAADCALRLREKEKARGLIVLLRALDSENGALAGLEERLAQ